MFGGLGNLGNLLSLASTLPAKLAAVKEELQAAELSVCVASENELSASASVKISANGLGQSAVVSLSEGLCRSESKDLLESLIAQGVEKLALEARALFQQKISDFAQKSGISLDAITGG